MTKAAPPQNGRVTHHHDQSIRLQSFRTTNTIPNTLSTPIPPLDEDEFDILIYFKLKNKCIKVLLNCKEIYSIFKKIKLK